MTAELRGVLVLSFSLCDSTPRLFIQLQPRVSFSFVVLIVPLQRIQVTSTQSQLHDPSPDALQVSSIVQ